MPTVLRVDPYRFFIYAGDRDEPPHIHVERDDEVCKFCHVERDDEVCKFCHVERDDEVCKFWLDPRRLQRSGGFNHAERRRIHDLVQRHREDVAIFTSCL
ncbi:hypothetical protein CCR95_17000 [Thiocystis minor]|uniref:DUF4160 domain-containing protein n=1 Tax=Thiocystis minor TaxID=61597 RepID=UPI0019131D76|nr:DUF4160 domain-containing protein [Thiocystis minor]MBK5965730.1 hypothetical protein [Thiocystis minor]